MFEKNQQHIKNNLNELKITFVLFYTFVKVSGFIF